MEFKPAKIRQGIYTTSDSGIEYRADILPAGSTDVDLSLLDFDSEDAPERYPDLARTLGEFAERIDAKRLFAPKLRFTRTLLKPEQLTVRIELPNGVPLFRSARAADAVILPEPGDGMVASMGGCSLIALACGTTLAAGHGGLDGLVHRDYVLGETETDEGSIVDTMCRAVLPPHRGMRTKASCRAFFSLPRKSYYFDLEHPTHGAYNFALNRLLDVRYDAHAQQIAVDDLWRRGFFLDQGRLIGAQARKHGVSTVSACLEPLRPHGHHAHTRHPDESMRPKRNLVAITRLA
ncbi:MAG TPA: hypothetical protein VHO23_02130 [Candidatus Paceibacterota bacterium]|nr:hypothetical protein [Candidatus Paceibacterota bacterium]